MFLGATKITNFTAWHECFKSALAHGLMLTKISVAFPMCLMCWRPSRSQFVAVMQNQRYKAQINSLVHHQSVSFFLLFCCSSHIILNPLTFVATSNKALLAMTGCSGMFAPDSPLSNTKNFTWRWHQKMGGGVLVSECRYFDFWVEKYPHLIAGVSLIHFSRQVGIESQWDTPAITHFSIKDEKPWYVSLL
jgi:hypothetical protein